MNGENYRILVKHDWLILKDFSCMLFLLICRRELCNPKCRIALALLCETMKLLFLAGVPCYLIVLYVMIIEQISEFGRLWHCSNQRTWKKEVFLEELEYFCIIFFVVYVIQVETSYVSQLCLLQIYASIAGTSSFYYSGCWILVVCSQLPILRTWCVKCWI